MNTAKLALACPICGSRDVFYSCEPKCCFNHVCANCKSTFEPVTHPTGARHPGAKAPEGERDPSEPTVACAKCESTEVYVIEDGRLVCCACGALLELEITDVAKG